VGVEVIGGVSSDIGKGDSSAVGVAVGVEVGVGERTIDGEGDFLTDIFDAEGEGLAGLAALVVYSLRIKALCSPKVTSPAYL